MPERRAGPQAGGVSFNLGVALPRYNQGVTSEGRPREAGKTH